MDSDRQLTFLINKHSIKRTVTADIILGLLNRSERIEHILFEIILITYLTHIIQKFLLHMLETK